MTPTPTDAQARFFIAGLGLAQIASWGSTFYSFPQIAERMSGDLGFTRVELYGAATLGVLLSGLAAYLVGVAIDRGLGRHLMAGGSVLVGMLLLAWSRVETLLPFYFILAGIGLLQAAILYEAAFAVVARRFGSLSARQGITAITLWGGFASTVFIPLIELLIALMDWRGTLMTLGLINILVCAPLYGWLIRPQHDVPLPAPGPVKVSAHHNGPVAAALRAPVFWLVLVSFTAHAATFSVLTYHLYPLLLERGLDAASTVAILAIIGPAQVVGRIVVRITFPTAPVRLLGSVVVLGFPVSVALLTLLPANFMVLLAVAALFGAANGIMTIIRGITVPEMVSRQAYGAINGLLTAPSMVARALAPVAAAALWMSAGSYQPVLVALLALCVILAGAFWAAAATTTRSRPA